MNDNEWQQVVQRVTTSGTTSDNKWYNEWQRITTSDNELQLVTTSGTTIDKKWQRMAMRARAVTASESSGRANENGTVHFKEWMTAIISMTKRDTLLLQGMDSWTLVNGLSLRIYKKLINK